MFLKLIIFASFVVTISGRIVYLDESKIVCLAQDLKDRGVLDRKVPLPRGDPTKCPLILPSYKESLRNMLRVKLRQRDLDKPGCLLNEFLKAHVIEYYVMKEVLGPPRNTTYERFQRLRDRYNEEVKDYIFDSVRLCDRDPNNVDMFFEIFETNKNLTEKYCYAKFAVKNQVIKIGDDDFYSLNVDCQSIIHLKELEEEGKLAEQYRESISNEEQLQCIIRKYRDYQIFKLQLGLQVIAEAEVSEYEKEINRANIFINLEPFNKVVRNCLNHDDSFNLMDYLRKLVSLN